MSEGQKPEQPQVDPMAPMVQFYDMLAKSWSGAMSEMVASKSFADTVSKQMEGNLELVGLMRQQVGVLMEEYLHQVSLPSRSDMTGLAERLTRIEMRLDDVDAKLDEVLDQLRAPQARVE